MTRRRVMVRVTGVVQGVGFRPFVYGLALANDLSGFVTNDPAGVLIDVEGPAVAVGQFLHGLRAQAPPMALIDEVSVSEAAPSGQVGFEIRASQDSTGTTTIPPDTAVCNDCLAEMQSPTDRRFQYPFIACTNCGPRYTIVSGLPYDRANTTMSDFQLCPACATEYEDPKSRRFHAQPTACAVCGPRVEFRQGQSRLTGAPAVAATAAALRNGSIVAIKGVGGYHLACNASDSLVVQRLRSRKRRGDKPFAVMVARLTEARALAEVTQVAADVLISAAAPIVLMKSRDSEIQASVAPGNVTIGVMLPYTGLHHLLFAAGAPNVLVMTSGNLSDEPICTDESEAEVRLAEIADAFCHHDRRIHIPCDDSVLQFVGEQIQPVRRSRGFAPLSVRLTRAIRPVVAVGGEVKTTVAVAVGNSAWMSQHIGDTENLETLASLARTVETLAALQRIVPEAIVSDRHPGYLSRRWAIDEAARRGIVHLEVQHHHAHLGALLAEHEWPESEPVLGVAFDGTGFGIDGSIWGGEFLVGGLTKVERVGSLGPICLPGGDGAIKRPARTALAHLYAAGLDWDPRLPPIAACADTELRVVRRMLESEVGCTPTTSMGRFFDAVASLLGVRQDVEYEGQAAIELEAMASLADSTANLDDWRLPLVDDEDGLVLDPAPILAAGIAAVIGGTDRRDAAAAFHLAVANGVLAMANRVKERFGTITVGLTGGVFTNRFLTTACIARLDAAGFHVLTHEVVPPNDGGLALGQVAVVAAGGMLSAAQLDGD